MVAGAGTGRTPCAVMPVRPWAGYDGRRAFEAATSYRVCSLLTHLAEGQLRAVDLLNTEQVQGQHDSDGVDDTVHGSDLMEVDLGRGTRTYSDHPPQGAEEQQGLSLPPTVEHRG
jgi:hypothetical protein